MNLLNNPLRLLLITLLLVLSATFIHTEPKPDLIRCKVTYVVDGDTFHCELASGKKEKVRLTGIDTPETRRIKKAYRDAERSNRDIETIIKLGKLSSQYTKSLLPVGSYVNLELDVQTHDRYGRLLAYVFLPEGERLNAQLVKEGYAQVMTIPPNVKYKELFIRFQKEAREKGKGLWGF